MFKKFHGNILYFFSIIMLMLFNLGIICVMLQSKNGIFTLRGGIIIVFCLLFELCLVIFLKEFDKIKIENKFLILFLIIGSLYLFVFPMNQTPDEGAHVFRAYEVSMGHLSSTINDKHFVGRELPVGILQVLDNPNYNKLLNNLSVKSNSKREFIDFSSSALYSFVCYLPQAFGIAISRLFTSRILVQLYFGRIFNFLVFTLLFYFSLKFIPTKKEFLFFLAFLPITIQEAISLSPDCLTIASSVFLFSYVMFLRKNKKEMITRKQILLLSVICVIISQCKIVYLPVCLLVFFIPKEKFKSLKRKYITILCMAGIVILFNLLWLYIASSFLQVSSSGKSGNQIQYILSNPFKYLFVCGSTFSREFQSWLFQSLGKNLGWFNIEVPDFYILGNLLILFIISVSYDKNIVLRANERLGFCFIYICTIALIFTSLYVQWNEYKALSILGIQGRYFQPIYYFLPFILSNGGFMIQKKVLSRYFYSFLILENVLVFSIVLIHYM